jgi:hypothetical protein
VVTLVALGSTYFFKSGFEAQARRGCCDAPALL